MWATAIVEVEISANRVARLANGSVGPQAPRQINLSVYRSDRQTYCTSTSPNIRAINGPLQCANSLGGGWSRTLRIALVGQLAIDRGPQPILQPVETSVCVADAPQAHRGRNRFQLARDLPRPVPFRRFQHDPYPQQLPVVAARSRASRTTRSPGRSRTFMASDIMPS